MIKRTNFAIAALLLQLMALQIHAETPAKPTGASITKGLMQHYLIELTALKKFMVSDQDFSDPKNQTEIAAHLGEFAKYAKLAKHDENLQSVNYRFSRQVLENYIVDTERLFRVGNKSFARWQLNSTVSVCMDCHTQMPTESRVFADFINRNPFTSGFDQAEFLFATRGFEKALVLYNNIIVDFPMNKFEPREVETAFERQLAYYLRLRRNPTEAIEKFKGQLQNKKIPGYIRENVTDWIVNLERLTKKPKPDPSTMKAEAVISYAKDELETNLVAKIGSSRDPNLVNYLLVSGVLYEFLKKNPESEYVPDILYYLSICDRNISNTFYYSLADLYLRECITKYPQKPMAKNCYREYEKETVLGYTGSSGTKVPSDVQEDLKNLKKLVDSGGKIKLSDH
jgi:hypothetical protein